LAHYRAPRREPATVPADNGGVRIRRPFGTVRWRLAALGWVAMIAAGYSGLGAGGAGTPGRAADRREIAIPDPNRCAGNL
jgi:hypothetical protein